jgi:hypothetical protein
MDMYSSSGRSSPALARPTASDARRFLRELANLRTDDDAAIQRLSINWERMLPEDLANQAVLSRIRDVDLGPGPKAELTKLLKAMQREIRGAWGCPTAYDRSLAFLVATGRYIIAVAEGFTRSAGDPSWIDPSWATFGLEKVSPPESIYELLPGVPVDLLRERGKQDFVRGLEESARRRYEYKLPVEQLSKDNFIHVLVHALNSVDRMRVCQNQECPAPYFYALKRNQRYCSGTCAAPSQREFKRKWWEEHGEKWRANRREKRVPQKSYR